MVKTKALLITSIIQSIFVIVVFVVIYTFILNQISDTVNKIDQIKTEIRRQETLSLMKKDVEDSTANESKIYGYFIGVNGVADFLKTIEGLVSSSSLQYDIQSIAYEAPSQPTAPINTELLRVKMSITGKWANVQHFLELIENYPLKIDIRSVSLNQTGDLTVSGKTVHQWSANIDFTALKLKNI